MINKTDNNSPLTDVALKVANKRYFRRNENGEVIEGWGGLTNRVVNHNCSHEVEQFKLDCYDAIYSRDFLPNSPCLVNSENQVGGLLACHVTKEPEDCWHAPNGVGMIENIANFGHVARRGGGCGVSLSKIRPEGDPVFGSTHAKACGPIEHMRMVSEVMSSITQAGFRSMAMMATLDISHPDVINFIKCKQRDRALKTMLKEDIFGHYQQIKNSTSDQLNIVLDKFISNFNISVVVNDKFMEAVKANKDWALVFNGKVYTTIKAQELFDLIVENAWKNGDPGLLFSDRINNSPYQYSKQYINATNPCVTGESLVPTKYGWKRVDSLKVGDLIFTQNRLSPITTIEVNENCQVYRVEFSDGGYVNATAAHRFKCIVNKQYQYLRLDEIGCGTKVLVENPIIDLMDRNNEWGDIISVDDKKISARDYGLIIGSILGDGCYTDRNTNKNHVDVSFSKQEKEWESIYCATLDKYGIKYYIEESGSTDRDRSNFLIPILELCGLERNIAPNKTIPQSLFNCNNKELIVGLLDGLFSTDGSMYLKKDNPMLRLSSASVEMLRQVRLLLLSLGIHSKIYKSDRKPHEIDGRQISIKNAKYDLVVMNVGIRKFHDIIKLSNKDKQCKIEECVKSYHYIGDNRCASIVSITPLDDTKTVYDIYAEETDEWNVHGYVQQGCGEQPLPPWGSCNLGSIDVAKFYDAEKNDVNWKRLKKVIRIAVQFLDNVIDANKFPTPDFEKWAKENRPVGLGIMGFADLLLKLGIAYGSDESFEFAEKLMKFFYKEAHAKSVELGKERGTPKCCKHDELEHRRNVTVVSIAPTGTISLLAGCSSSIEPIYSSTIFRYDNTGSYEMPHPESSKKYFRSAINTDSKKEITWEQHVRMQAAFQKYCDSGISKTINMRNSATIEDVRKAYMLAWELDAKGITVYRDGSKTTQVLNTKDKNSVGLGSNNAVKRPEVIPCDIIKTTASGIEWHIIIGKVDGVPYELFAVNGKHGHMPLSGYVVKNKSRDYSLLDENKNIILKNIIEAQEDIDSKISLETRRFSLELRHGIHPKFIVQQIDKSSETLSSFSKVVGRIFKNKYISDEELIQTLRVEDRVCPECQKPIISEAGCIRCSDESCGYSKCG